MKGPFGFIGKYFGGNVDDYVEYLEEKIFGNMPTALKMDIKDTGSHEHEVSQSADSGWSQHAQDIWDARDAQNGPGYSEHWRQ